MSFNLALVLFGGAYDTPLAWLLTLHDASITHERDRISREWRMTIQPSVSIIIGVFYKDLATFAHWGEISIIEPEIGPRLQHWNRCHLTKLRGLCWWLEINAKSMPRWFSVLLIEQVIAILLVIVIHVRGLRLVVSKGWPDALWLDSSRLRPLRTINLISTPQHELIEFWVALARCHLQLWVDSHAADFGRFGPWHHWNWHLVLAALYKLKMGVALILGVVLHANRAHLG